MLLETSIYPLMDLFGTIAFACSGAMIAMQRKLDYLGVVTLGLTTAFGGGICRDIILGRIPPTVFQEPGNAIIAFWISTFLFVAVKNKWSAKLHLQSEEYEEIMNILDAIGLGIFTVTGINKALLFGYEKYPYFCIFLGVLTGVGGGVLRDIFSGETPAVFRKHIYACASLAGGVFYYYTRHTLGDDVAILTSSLIIFVIRILARHYLWNLPKADSELAVAGHAKV